MAVLATWTTAKAATAAATTATAATRPALRLWATGSGLGSHGRRRLPPIAAVAATTTLRGRLGRHYSTESSSSSSPSPTRSAAAHVLERYRQQLDAKARQEGVSDIEALRAAYADKIEAVRRRDAVVPREASAASAETNAASAEKAETNAASAARAETNAASAPLPASTTAAAKQASSPAAPRALSSFLEVDKARQLPAEELSAIWRLRFAHDPRSLCAVIPAATYAAMEAAARARPQFVLPVPHPEQGAEVHFLQWTFGDGSSAATSSTVLFTQLAEYKLRGEFAQPHTTVTHYTDLATDCGVVLMQGQVAADRGVSPDSAQFLAMCLQRFYGAWSIPSDRSSRPGGGIDEGARQRRLLLQWFAAGDPQFSIEKLMEEVEKLA